MTGQRNARKRLALLAIGAALSLTSLSVATTVPVANGADGVVSLDVSWVRPGVPDPMTVPAALRMGDVVTIHSSSIGLTNPTCQTVFIGDAPNHDDPYMWVRHDAAATSVCPDWTFVVPPSPPGPYRIEAAASDPAFSETNLAVTIEAGGTHVPFASNFPVLSWAPSDFVTSGSVAFGSPFVVDLPGSQTACEASISGLPWSGLEVSSPTCADWSVTLPETRPAASTSGAFAAPFAGHLLMSARGSSLGRGFAVTTNSTGLSIEGDDAALASTIPATIFPATTNPYFVAAGAVPLRPALAGIPAGTCAFLVKVPGQSSMTDAGTVDVVDGQCGPLAFDAQVLGTYQMDVRVSNGGPQIAESWGGFVVTEPIPAPTIDLPADPPLIGADVPIGIAVASGIPASYQIDITPGSPDCTGESGALDAMHAALEATATCKFDAAGTYQIDATMTDVLGTTTHTTRTLTVVAEDTTAPSVTPAPMAFVSGGTVASGKVPARFAWLGTDAGSGVATYDIELQTDSGAFAPIATGTTATSLARSLVPGHRYRIRVRAKDHDDNVSSWVYGPNSAITSRQETSTSIKWHGTWRTAASTAYWGGKGRYATQAGATASITFTGRAFTWVGVVGPTRGTARVYVNGTLVRSVDLHATTAAARRLVYSVAWPTAALRTVTIRVSGTSGHPRGDLDAFVTGS